MSIETGTNDVIVADNDYIIRNILRSLLEGKGFTVLSAIDGLEAVDYATRTIARFVILDLRMPKLDGFAACSQIRQLPGYPNVPIAILSAFPGTETREAAKNAGATTFLSKPFTPIEVVACDRRDVDGTADRSRARPRRWCGRDGGSHHRSTATL